MGRTQLLNIYGIMGIYCVVQAIEVLLTEMQRTYTVYTVIPVRNLCSRSLSFSSVKLV